MCPIARHHLRLLNSFVFRYDIFISFEILNRKLICVNFRFPTSIKPLIKAQDRTEQHTVTNVTKQESGKGSVYLTRADRKTDLKFASYELFVWRSFAQRRFLLSIRIVVKICSVAHLRDFFYLKVILTYILIYLLIYLRS
jgi:hypothetical protein